MAHLTVSVLGELEVSIDDVPIQSFESDKVRALLAYLVVEADRSHPREALIGLLWPDSAEEVARHNLRQALFNLRLVLGDHTAKPPYLLITRGAIQFNRESDYSLDLDQFNGYFYAWEKNQDPENTDTSSLVPQLEEMVKQYQGDYLQHFSLRDSAEFEDWVLVQRESLRQRMMNVLTYLANEYEHRGNFQAARCYALHQLKLDPWREEAHYQVMQMLAFEGERSSALAQYENCKKVLAEELGIEPSAKTRDLYEQIRSGALKTKHEMPANVPSIPVQSLPVALTPFIGREEELAELDRLITDPECRCITLVGPGGIGKTRLALQAADQHRNTFADGVAFIPLASVGSIDAVIPAFANAIQFAFYGPAEPKVQLLNYLRDKQMLLIVDNAEHLLVEAPHRGTIADLLIELLQGADQIKLLVTSRETLNLQGEYPFELEGLDFPRVDQTDRLDEYGSVALFLQRAQRARPRFEMNMEDKNSVARLCRLVEGMPLAIELAATWVRLLSPAEIATEIEQSLDFLNAQMRDLPERHRSMRAVFDHSWQMLSTEEKGVLRRLSVFRGGFQRQAAEQVADASLSILSSLVMRSLLRRTVAGRYDLHELIRQYAALKLAEDPDVLRATQERHSLYYLGLLEEKGTKLFSHHQEQALAELLADMDNLRASWDWSIATHKFIPLYQVSFTFLYLFTLRDWFKEGEVTFKKTAEAMQAYLQEVGSDTALQQTAMHAMLAHYGYFKLRQGRNEEAYAILAPSTTFLRTCTEPTATIYSLWYLGVDCWILGKFSEAKGSFQAGAALARKYGERWHEVLAVEFLGRVAQEQGEYSQARQYFSEALTIIRQLGDPSMTAHVLSYFGRLMQSLGEYGEAEKLLSEGLELARTINYRFAIGLALDGLGKVAYDQGRYQEARTFFSESAGLFREMGDHRLSRTLNHQGLNSLALGDTADAQNAFQAALKMAMEGGLVPIALNALTGLAALETQQAASRETLELILYILQHPSSTQETKNLATQLRVELEAKLSQEEIEVAQQRARSKSLDEFVRQVMSDARDSSKGT
jgi:DNA-binding SARP family transcriptional activator/predicted ATPase